MKDIARDTSPCFVPKILGSSCYTGCCKSEWTLKELKQAECRKILQIEPKYPVECKSSNCTIRIEGYRLIFPSLPSFVIFCYSLFFFLLLNFFFPLCLYFWFRDFITLLPTLFVTRLDTHKAWKQADGSAMRTMHIMHTVHLQCAMQTMHTMI